MAGEFSQHGSGTIERSNYSKTLGDAQGSSKRLDLNVWDPYDSTQWAAPEVSHTYQDKGKITKVDGVNAYSQVQALYRGTGRLQEFLPQPGLNTETGKMPAGKFNDYAYTYPERDKMGFDPYGTTPQSPKTPAISPQASGVETSTVYSGAIHTTWRDLRSQLNIGQGSRTNKYLLEFNMPILDPVAPAKLNILCQATSFPQRQINVATVWRFGRQYNMRGETNYGGSWTLTFVDDSKLEIRKRLDEWMIQIDDSGYQDTALDAEYGSTVDERVRANGLDIIPRETGPKVNFGDIFRGLADSLLRKAYTASLPRYQTDIRVYQLDQVGNKTMGYVIQNAWVSAVDQVDYKDDENDQLVKYSITITFSEFLPLADDTLDETIRL